MSCTSRGSQRKVTETATDFTSTPFAAMQALSQQEAQTQPQWFYLGGVTQGCWSQADQIRMANGELPKGRPEHPNC